MWGWDGVQVKRTSFNLKDSGWGYLYLQEYQRSAKHSIVTSSGSGEC